MRRDPRVLLDDAARAHERVRRFTSGRTFVDYAADEILRSAVERQLAILDESLWRLRTVAPEIAGRIGDIDRIIGFRHVLVHGYASVDDRLVWGIVEGRLDGLGRAIADRLAELNAAGRPKD